MGIVLLVLGVVCLLAGVGAAIRGALVQGVVLVLLGLLLIPGGVFVFN